jgi:hypothetical protein
VVTHICCQGIVEVLSRCCQGVVKVLSRCCRVFCQGCRGRGSSGRALGLACDVEAAGWSISTTSEKLHVEIMLHGARAPVRGVWRGIYRVAIFFRAGRAAGQRSVGLTRSRDERSMPRLISPAVFMSDLALGPLHTVPRPPPGSPPELPVPQRRSRLFGSSLRPCTRGSCALGRCMRPR